MTLTPAPGPLCGSGMYNPDMWSSDIPSEQSLAAHLCKHHCPLQQRCLKEALARPKLYEATVMGGYYLARGVGLPRYGQQAPDAVRPYALPQEGIAMCDLCTDKPRTDLPKTNSKRRCGTRVAFMRHQRLNETCDVCTNYASAVLASAE